jgi:ABC-type spermidine/putrescine transport system permease subunit II
MRRVGWGAVALLCLLLLGPIVVVVIVSFSGDSYLAFPPSTLSLRWYVRFLGDPRWRDALWNSLIVAVLCSIFATSIGFLTAYAFVRGRFFARGALMSIAVMPLIVPSIVTAIAIYFLTVRLGFIGSRLWLAVTHSVVALPLVVIITQSALQALDPALERAAMVHGCTRFGVFRRVVIPMAAPGIISAALFAFLASFDELVIALFVSGVQAQTLPVRIWNSLTMELEPTIAAVSALLIAMTLLILLLDAGFRALAARRQRQL